MQLECLLIISIIATSSQRPSAKTSSGCECAIRKVLAERQYAECPKCCAMYSYDPVCGYNPCEEEAPDMMFRTFENKCEAEGTICDGPGHYYYYVYDGVCVMDLQDDNSCLVPRD